MRRGLRGAAFAVSVMLGNSASGAEVSKEIAVDGRMRSYQVHVPPGVADPKAAPWPLVVVLHGGGGNAPTAARQTGFSAEADRSGFVTAYPNGSGRALLGERLLVWNAGSCCGFAVEHSIDDVAFIRAMVGEIQHDYGTDPARTFATGISNGGMLAYRLACEASDVFAAIAPVSAVDTGSGCHPTEAVSVVHFHGSADQNVPLGGGVGARAYSRDPRPPVADTLKFWVKFDGCIPGPAVTNTGAVREERYSGCREGSEVRFYRIEGGGHAWPGGERMLGLLDPPSTAIAATPVIWQFFASHDRYGRPAQRVP